MNPRKYLIDKLKKRLHRCFYYYISNEIEHAIGLEEYVEKMHFACLNYNDTVDYMKEKGLLVLSLRREGLQDGITSSGGIMKFMDKNYTDLKDSYFQTFKISRSFENIVAKVEANLMNTPAALNEKFERKISQTRIFKNCNLKIPYTRISTAAKEEFSDLEKEFGLPFVIQFNRGHTGSGTRFINTDIDLQVLKIKFPNRPIRISKYVKGETYSVNCCMTQTGIYIGGLYRQITGVPELTAEKGGTVGGTFNHKLPEKVVEDLRSQLKLLTAVLKEHGYKGLFGLDFMFNEETEEIQIIEMNARQQMTVTFNSRLNIIDDIDPINSLHMAEFLDVDNNINPKHYNEINTQNRMAAQLYLRNRAYDDAKIRRTFPTGEYRITEKFRSEPIFSNLEFVAKKYLIDEISEGNILLLTQKSGQEIPHGAELARIQTRNDIFDNNNNLEKIYIDILKSVEKEIV